MILGESATSCSIQPNGAGFPTARAGPLLCPAPLWEGDRTISQVSSVGRWTGVLALIALILLPACGGVAPSPTPAAQAALPAYWPTTGWRSTTPEEQGVDSQRLLAALQRVDEANINLRSLTVIRNGYVVLDAYYQPFTADRQYVMASVTKSVTGALVGIAVQEGKIKSITEPALSYFPELTVANRDARKDALTIESLLTMQPGLDCGDDVLNGRMEASPNWVQFTLDLPMKTDPGKNLVYCTAGTHLLSAILTRATGMSTRDYAQARLFGPLGIKATNYAWDTDPQGIAIGGYGLHLRPADMGKLGLLYLSGGKWDTAQVVPADWVAAATQIHAYGDNNKNYGYLFWLYPTHFAAEGLGEQKIMVVKDRNLVVVMTAAIDWHKSQPLEGLLTDYIIPAARSDTALPANPGALASLRNKVAALANPVQPVAAQPVLAAAVSGKTYMMEANDSGVDWVRITFEPGRAEAQVSVQSGGQEVQVLMGLDNVYRVTTNPQAGGAVALRGYWADDHTLVARKLDLTTMQEEEWRISFSGNTIQAQIEEKVFGAYSTDLRGVAK
jgi:CubicO group peptidase (beta-lactamase class C family)